MGPQTSATLLASSIAFVAALALTAPLSGKRPDQSKAAESRVNAESVTPDLAKKSSTADVSPNKENISEKVPEHSGTNKITEPEREMPNSVQNEKSTPAEKDAI